VKIAVRNSCDDFKSYRAARVKSLFNVESGANFEHEANLEIDDGSWQIGLIVGPSGSGKTSLGKRIFGRDDAIYSPNGWAHDKPIVDCILPGGDFDAVTGALAAVGLGSVPSWLRPYPVLSNGEKFRADLARIVCEEPDEIVVDEFTSVVDRQIAKFGAMAFSKAWKRTKGKRCVLLSCHYDIIEWVEPDWVYDTQTATFQRGQAGRSLWRRPRFDLEVWEVDRSYWPLFAPHYYLSLPPMIAATYYVGTVEGEPACHLAVSPRLEVGGMRASRMVVMPEWQGAGIGLRFLNAICEHQTSGQGKYGDRVKAVYFHTSHPGLCAGLRRDKRWRQTSAKLHGESKKGARKRGMATGYGGHWRAVQGFKYIGAAA
jgi:GNAT superfamily N-acetyltransferase